MTKVRRSNINETSGESSVFRADLATSEELGAVAVPID
jgi:hypothetical protein